jgi:hypothetical protein
LIHLHGIKISTFQLSLLRTIKPLIANKLG